MKKKIIKYFKDTNIVVSAPIGVLCCEMIDSDKIKISLDTTKLSDSAEGAFLVRLEKKDASFVFPEKINWEIGKIRSTKRPRFCIQVFAGDNKYRDFVSDLTYSAEKNTIEMSNISKNTTAIVLKFMEEFNRNSKFEFVIQARN